MTAFTLKKGDSQVFVGFRPHDMGVKVQLPGHLYHPEWSLAGEMKFSADFAGPPEYWCTDGHRVYFDKPAAADYPVEVTPKDAT